MKLRSVLLASAVTLGLAAAFYAPSVKVSFADVTYTQGSGTTLFDFLCFSTKHCTAHVNITSAGVELFTTSNPGSVAEADGANVTLGAKADTAWTSGSGSVVSVLKAIANFLSTIASNTGGPIPAGSNTIGAVTRVASSTGGASTWHLIAAASTNATSVQGSATTVYACQLGNNSATLAYLKIYNKATAPTVGTDTPVKTLLIPASTSGNGSNVVFPVGIALGTGFAAAVTTGIADSDTGAVAAATYTLNCDYK